MNDKEAENNDSFDRPSKETLEEWYWGDGLSLREIASKVGTTYGTVQWWFRDLDIDKRESGGHKQLHPTIYQTVNGYIYARDDGNGTIPIHRLIAIAENGVDAVKGRIVHHKNGVKWDNRSDNLEVMAQKEHQRHHKSGEKTSEKLTEDDAVEIKRLAINGNLTQREIAERYEIDPSYVSMIKNGERWHHIDVESD